MRSVPVLRPERFVPGGLPTEKIANFLRPARRAARLEPMPGRVRRCCGIESVDFRFPSPVRTGDGRNDMVRGRRYRSPDRPDAPAVIFSLPYRVAFIYHPFDRFARACVRAGWQAVIYQPPYHYDRRLIRGNPGEGVVTARFGRALRGIQQGVKDLSALIQGLRAEGAPRVALFGMSFGGLLGGHTACAPDGPDSLILLVPSFCTDRIVRDRPIFRRLRANLRRSQTGIENTARLWGSVRLDRRTPLLPTERILIMRSIYDQIVPFEEYDSLAKAWGQPRIVDFPHGHISVLTERRIVPLLLEHLEKKSG